MNEVVLQALVLYSISVLIAIPIGLLWVKFKRRKNE